MKRRTKITAGNFAKGDNNQGNFTGYNANGDKIFISKTMLLGLKIETDADFNPFYAVIDERDIPTRDEAGELTTIMTKRLQAISIFATEAELVEGVNADASIDIAVKADLALKATTAGLSEETIQALLLAL